ncbi:MAG: hypothetical protein ABSB70_06045 [Candidatus Velthaea sp.]
MALSESVIGWGVALAVGAATVAAVVVSNSGSGTYQDNANHTYGAASSSAAVSVAAISSAMVMPKQAAADTTADAVTAGTVATKTFIITNQSNISDAYVITAAGVSAGSVQNVAFAPANAAAVAATVGSTVSPAVPPGASLSVTVAVATANAPIGSSIAVSLTAKTTAAAANGAQSDSGKAWVFVAHGPQISGVAPPNTPAASGGSNGSAALAVSGLVNGAPVAQAQPGSTLNFNLPFTNLGDAPALGVVVVDQIPPDLHPIAGSLTLQSVDHRTARMIASVGARVTIAGNTVSATIPRLDPGVDVTIGFQATTSSSVPIGTTIANPAVISAESVAKIAAVPAIVFVGVMDTVYDALGGSAHPIAGAVVSLIDPNTGLAPKLPTVGPALNASNVNPFSTASSGTFGFALAAASSRSTDYDLYVTAPDYLNRKIRLTVGTAADGALTTTLRALDDLPLASVGGFGLTSAPVSVTGVSGFFGNVPLFSPQALSLSIAVDRTVASAGDRLGYSVDFGPGNKPLTGAAQLTIALPAGVAYAHGTARLDTVAIEPAASARSLSWPVKDLAGRHTLAFDTVVLPGVSESTTINTRAHLSVMVLGAALTTDAGVDVAVVGGPLSSRSILTGRVFADHAHSGHFVPGDLGLPGVRIYLEDGESVQTDGDGRFSFPAVRPGQHVLHLDPVTLPAGMHPYHGHAVNDSRSSVQLVHGIFDAGLMHDVSFAVNEGAD